jgi:hypothetical protein
LKQLVVNLMHSFAADTKKDSVRFFLARRIKR